MALHSCDRRVLLAFDVVVGTRQQEVANKVGQYLSDSYTRSLANAKVGLLGPAQVGLSTMRDATTYTSTGAVVAWSCGEHDEDQVA